MTVNGACLCAAADCQGACQADTAKAQGDSPLLRIQHAHSCSIA